ncbi:unnamed protein product [Allacma fusca]|uniref:EF-hand domain-containing protein n=1 Tax=Allacma fusca TaxID=39272 RepID=A0A8J2PL27_9HEXA|nr:unnamed protein product [Allacma fusca]
MGSQIKLQNKDSHLSARPTLSLVFSKFAVHKEFDEMAEAKYQEVQSHSRASYQQAHRYSHRRSSLGGRRESQNRHLIIDATQPDYINALHSRVALGRKGVDEQVSDLSLFGVKKDVPIYTVSAQTPVPESKVRRTRHHPKIKGMTRKEEEAYVQTLPQFQRFEYMTKKLHFNIQEIHNLHKMFNVITDVPPRQGYMNRSLFTDFCRTSFDITDDIMLDQMFHYFDADGEGFISFSEWVQILSIFLRGTFEEQIKYCFNIYDLDFNGTVERKEIMTLVLDCLTDTVAGQDEFEIHEHVREIVEMLMKKLDMSRTGTIRAHDFHQAVTRDSSLLQCLGRCLPDQDKIISFLSIFTDDINNYKTNYCLESVGTAGFQYDKMPRLKNKKTGVASEFVFPKERRRTKTYRDHYTLPKASKSESNSRCLTLPFTWLLASMHTITINLAANFNSILILYALYKIF